MADTGIRTQFSCIGPNSGPGNNKLIHKINEKEIERDRDAVIAVACAGFVQQCPKWSAAVTA